MRSPDATDDGVRLTRDADRMTHVFRRLLTQHHVPYFELPGLGSSVEARVDAVLAHMGLALGHA